MCKTQMKFQRRKCFHPARRVTTSSRSSKKKFPADLQFWVLFVLGAGVRKTVGFGFWRVGWQQWKKCWIFFLFFSVCVCACASVCQMCITAAAWLQSCWCNDRSSKWIMVSVNAAIRPFGFCFPVFLGELMQCLFLTWVLQQVTTKTHYQYVWGKSEQSTEECYCPWTCEGRLGSDISSLRSHYSFFAK